MKCVAVVIGIYEPAVAPLAGAWSVIAADELFVQLRKVFL